MLPPDTPIPKSNAGRPRKRKTPQGSGTPSAKARKKTHATRPSTPDAIELQYDSEEEEEDPGPDSDPETSLDVPLCKTANWTRPTTVHWDPDSKEGSKVGWKIKLYDDISGEWADGRIVLYDPYTHKHKVKYDAEPRHGEVADAQNCVWVRLVNEVSGERGAAIVI